jgi:hypothetical protein
MSLATLARHYVTRHAVQIEPGLQPQSPENGNISNIRRRLSAISSWKEPKVVSGDRPAICKSPPLAGISEVTKGKVSRRRTGWLGREDSNLRMVESKSIKASRHAPTGVRSTAKSHMKSLT